ncbi:MAG: cytidylate kinase-like family protein [Ruminococcaceae bacterium]|nr:cytidylate kinase-like family protein [Oscillospiraceae bacterium]
MKNIITISREFGSGGRTIGKLVAQKLGYEFYDSEIVNQVAQRSGFSPEFIQENGEYATAKSSLLYALATANQYSLGGVSTLDKLYLEQTKIIKEIADRGKCVIVGRCADYVLRERTDCLHVYICADEKYRAERIVQVYGESDKKPEKRIHEKDQKRKVYYRNYTGQALGQPLNYALSLNSGILGEELCAELIVQAAK